jgi:acid phosphatase (class A)
MKPVQILILFGVIFLMGYVWSQTEGPGRTGYLAAGEMPDMIRIAPPAPSVGDPVDARDRAIFHATRSFEGTPRWSMALSDDDVSVAGLLRAFRCSTGMQLSAENAPKLTALLSRANLDSVTASGKPKNFYKRPRPFLSEEGPTCVPASKYQNNPDYPSGHTVASWTAGLILAELEPDRATGILIRARAFGESRVVCGVHYASAVDAGWTIADSLVAAMHASPAFRSDLEAARQELKSLRERLPLQSAECDSEAALIARRAYTP